MIKIPLEAQKNQTLSARLPMGRLALSILLILLFPLGLALVSSTALAQDVISTFAGGGPNNLPAVPGLNPPATAANLNQPTAVAVDSVGNLYIASPVQNRVFRVDHGTGVLTVFAGNGTPGYSGDGSLAVNAALRSPQAVALDSTRNYLYIADSQNNVVRKVDLNVSPPTITTVAGSGISGFSDGIAAQAQFARPFGLAVDGTGNIYVADIDNNRVREVNTSGMVTTVAGNGAAGFSGDGGSATVASLNQPMSVALDNSGNLYISDSGNHRVRMVGTNFFITTVAGNGTSGSNTSGVPATSVGLSGRLGVVAVGATPATFFIADADDGLVRKVDGATQNITTVAGNGCFGFSLGSSCSFNIANGDGTAAGTASLNGPIGVALDGSGNVFIADTGNNRIRVVNEQLSQITVASVTIQPGNIATVAGNGLTYSGDNSPAVIASLNSPQGVAVDGSGNTFIADTDDNLIRKVDLAGTITTVAGNGCFGYAIGDPPKCDITSDPTAGDSVLAVNASLAGPVNVATDSSGNLYIADSSNQRIRVVNTTAMPITVAGVAIPPGDIATVAGNGCPGFAMSGSPCGNNPSAGDGASATSASLNFPSSIAVDRSSRNIYISDTKNNRVRAVNAQTGVIDTVSADLNSPAGIAFDSQGNLYIADQGNHRIQKVTASGSISTVAGTTGMQGFSGDGGPATSALLRFPAAVVIDGTGNLYIADFGNQRVRVTAASTQMIGTEAGDGIRGFSGDTGPAYAARLANPSGLALDGSNNLLIADTINNRIRKITGPTIPGLVEDFSASASPSTATVTAGQTATYTVTVQPVGGFSQTVALTCSGAPIEATCSVSPASVTLDGINSASVHVMVTTSPLSTAQTPGPFSKLWPRTPTNMAWFACLLIVSTGLMWVRSRRSVLPCLFLACFVATLSSASCGGGSSPLPILRGTPPGSYMLTVSATSGSLSHNVSLTLTVN
ncbi:MAG: NHL domain-containing protein [Terriglobia bacterium]